MNNFSPIEKKFLLYCGLNHSQIKEISPIKLYDMILNYVVTTSNDTSKWIKVIEFYRHINKQSFPRQNIEENIKKYFPELT